MKKISLLLVLSFVNTIGAAIAAPMPSEGASAPFFKELESEKELTKEKEQSDAEEVKREFRFHEVADWERGDIKANYLKINPLQFQNKASCALDSKKPTLSFNVLIDTLNMAKGAYRLAQASGHEPNDFSRYAVERFRYGVLHLIHYISIKMIRGDFPILPSDVTEIDETTKNSRFDARSYRETVTRCRLDGYCLGLDDYISKIWNYEKDQRTLGKPLDWKTVDAFSEKNFIDYSKLVKKADETVNLSCYYLKKYSPLQSHFDAVTPDKSSLSVMAQMMINQKDLIASCDDLAAQKSIEFAPYQIDILGVNPKEWKKIGFDFFHSLKLYLSWAWRFAPDVAPFFSPYQNYFKSVHLEDAVMFFSNGCASIQKPKCETSFLNEQSLREFAAKDFGTTDSSVDKLLYAPEGSAYDMIRDQDPKTHSGAVDFKQFPTMDDWMNNFRDNLIKTRGIMKGRLIRSVTNLQLILQNLKKEEILNDIKLLKEGKKAIPYSMGSRKADDLKRMELYALCAEGFVAGDELLSFLRQKLYMIQTLEDFDPIFKNLSDYHLKDFYGYYEGLFSSVRSYCSSLEKENFWGSDFQMDKTLFSPWYKESIYKGQNLSAKPEAVQKIAQPLLAYKFFQTTQSSDEVICWDGIDCSRKVLDAIVSLYSLVQYQQLYFPKTQAVQTPELANPYAERVACKVYDPWWQTKKAFFHLLSNVGYAGMSLVNPTPFFITADISPKTMTSFNQLVEKGVLKVDPKYDSKKLLMSYGADLGRWLGVPCTVSLSNYAPISLPSSRFYFQGLTLEACGANTKGNVLVNNASDINKTPTKTMGGCVSCSLNFVNMAQSPTAVVPLPFPAVQSSFYLLRGAILFLKEMRDPVNVPRRFEVNPNYVLETYRRYGEIPHNCVSRLKKGKYCMENLCEQSIAQLFQEEVGDSIEGIDLRTDNAYVKTSYCASKSRIKNVRVFLNLFCRKNLDKDHLILGPGCTENKRRIKYELP